MAAGKESQRGPSADTHASHFSLDSRLVLIEVQPLHQCFQCLLALTCLGVNLGKVDEEIGFEGSPLNRCATEVDSILQIVLSQSHDKPIVGKIARVLRVRLKGHSEGVS